MRVAEERKARRDLIAAQKSAKEQRLRILKQQKMKEQAMRIAADREQKEAELALAKAVAEASIFCVCGGRQNRCGVPGETINIVRVLFCDAVRPALCCQSGCLRHRQFFLYFFCLDALLCCIIFFFYFFPFCVLLLLLRLVW